MSDVTPHELHLVFVVEQLLTKCFRFAHVAGAMQSQYIDHRKALLKSVMSNPRFCVYVDYIYVYSFCLTKLFPASPFHVWKVCKCRLALDVSVINGSEVR